MALLRLSAIYAAIVFVLKASHVDSEISQKEFSTALHDEAKSYSSLRTLSKYHADQEDNRNLPVNPSNILVVGGTEAEPHQFPFQISLQVRNYYGGNDHNCGGVIYDETHILTAAHCVRGYHQRNLKVVAGEHELFHDKGTEQYRDVLGYVFHPGFNPQTFDNDIAILTLDFPLDLNDHIQPLALPSRILENPQIARTSGWGRNGYDNEQQLKLLYVDLYVFTKEECFEAWSGKITEGMLCAGGENGEGGKGSCNGDSGGPLICRDVNDRDYLCGLVSWGSIECGAPNLPTVFTSISNYLDWLGALLPSQDMSSG